MFTSTRRLAREADDRQRAVLEARNRELEDRIREVTDLAAAVEAELTNERRDLMREIQTLNRALGKAEARAYEAEKKADRAVNNFEWARLRMNELERTNAMFLTRVLNMPVAAFQLDREDTPGPAAPPAAPREPGVPLGVGVPNASMFEDVGDEVAAQLGYRPAAEPAEAT